MRGWQLALPRVLREIGRTLLTHFFARFQQDLAARKIALPPPTLGDDHYYQAIACLLRSPAALPTRLQEALVDIKEIASPEQSQFLHEAVAHAGLVIASYPKPSPEKLALDLWLANPAILAGDYAGQNLIRLISFEGFASRAASSDRAMMPQPTEALLNEMTVRLDLWFARTRRDAHTARIDFHLNNPGEYWFLVRHGDIRRWIYNIQDRKTELIRFRPEDEDAILYLADEDELWITAQTEGDRDLYRALFGFFLRGSADYFSQVCTFTLEPLRTGCSEALDPTGLKGMSGLNVRQLERDAGFRGQESALNRAAFLVQFEESERWRAVELCLPTTLRLQPGSDVASVIHWSSKRAFRIPD